MSDFPIVIVGTGFAGIAMGAMLKRAGIDSFTILEKADDVGGTWRENTYPGAACDVPSHLYSFSFAPKADWSRAYSPQGEIHDYLRQCVERFDLRRHIHFGTSVTGAEFDESSGTWTVRLDGGQTLKARALVLGNGALHLAAYPDIPGLERFSGPCFHSAEWDHDVDLRDKRVAVIGTGASAIQFVPEIAGAVGQMHVFQRTPPWIMPKPDHRMPSWQQRLFKALPLLHWLHRAWIYWTFEMRAVGFVVDPRILRWLQKLALKYLAACVSDPALRAKLTPHYTMGCKRILMSNDYYQALQRPNVEVVTDGIEAITPTGVRTRDGIERPVDAIICGTGFAVGDYLARLDIVGRRGRRLADDLRARKGTYFGITANGFPNLFLLMGPNTGLGHNSMIFMIEAQARYALQAIKALRRRRLRFLDVFEPVQRAFNDRLQAQMRRCVWSSGCQSWYIDADGYNSTAWPYFTYQYWWRTRRFSLPDYEAVADPVAIPAPLSFAAPAVTTITPIGHSESTAQRWTTIERIEGIDGVPVTASVPPPT